MNERDELLEAAALAVEEPEFGDLRGALTPTKKGQREYELRSTAIADTRRRCAETIRAMKTGRGLDPLTQLRRIAEAKAVQHDLHLIEAWPLAWKGWLTIKCSIVCNSNSVPPETKYTIELTDAGRAALKTAE